jgi:hypothetical protein
MDHPALANPISILSTIGRDRCRRPGVTLRRAPARASCARSTALCAACSGVYDASIAEQRGGCRDPHGGSRNLRRHIRRRRPQDTYRHHL